METTQPATVTQAAATLPVSVTDAVATLPASMSNVVATLPANVKEAAATLAASVPDVNANLPKSLTDGAAHVTTESAQKALEAPTCKDVTQANDPLCYGNVTWAMNTGIYEYPEWYADYPILSVSGSFEAFQYVLADKVGPGLLKPDGNGWNCPAPCSLDVPACAEITSASPGQCYQNILWAKETGLEKKPEWYSDFPSLNVNSSNNDFQYVLHAKIASGEGTGWECPLPCSSSFIASTTPAAPATTIAVLGLSSPTTTTTLTTTTTTSTLDNGSALPWWAWPLLLGLCGLCLAAAAAAVYFYKKKRGVKKSKRAVKSMPVPAPAAAPAAAQESAPAPCTAAPAPTLHAVPVNYMAAAPIQYAAASPQVPLRALPVQSVAMPMAEPVQAMPAYARQGNQAMSLFNQLDSNHDGTLSRAEFAPMALFEQLDSNHDGTLSRAEFDRLRR